MDKLEYGKKCSKTKVFISGVLSGLGIWAAYSIFDGIFIYFFG